MLRKVLKWIGIVIGSLLVIILIFCAIVYFKTQSRINKKYEVKLQFLTIPVADSSLYQEGKHLAEIRGCTGCHGDNLAGGRALADENSPIGVLYVPNITSGKGGIQFQDADWIRVLRHGLDNNNHSLWFMPSQDYTDVSNREMIALISYLKQLKPVDKTVPQHQLKPLGRLLTFLNKMPLLPAEYIDHNKVYKDSVQVAVSADYGKYLVTTCRGCHGDNFKGGPSHSPTEPDIPNISSTGEINNWNDAEFISALQTGKKPNGKILSDAMPWKSFAFNADELKAIHLYLKTVK